ncbi:Integral membrane sensor signal transduction histidine kinase [Elusimicrobium minutum Pei191]|uniref:histidine kinase n=1 Tax=Elusimicrobium minutum (strain Pei191) TaxID=445932 RepID=B2KE03_ELUMP|nr:PAS domain-containing sensor histidine kinase [Elusimicrobium minutum]ACC98749.1 Integral membrane sensor signal transduction histidine kinase [Elusimicrobium minutum Pei191]
MYKGKSKTLFWAIVKVLMLAALLPVIMLGVYMVEMDSRMIKAELLEKQSIMNVTIESNVRGYLGRKRGFLRSFISIHDTFSEHSGINKMDLSLLISMNEDAVAAAFMDVNGNIKEEVGDVNLAFTRNGEFNAIRYLTLNKKEDYVGVITREDNKDTMLIAVPYVYNGKSKGALIARFNITEMVEGIAEYFVDGVFYAIFTTDGNIVTSSGPVSEDVKRIMASSPGKRNSEIKFSDGRRYLVTTSIISATGWIVYVQQSSKSWTAIILKDSHALGVIFIMAVAVIILIVLLSKIAIKPIIEPVKILQESATLLGKGNFDYLPKLENMPSNEVGDLGRAFVSMAESLKKQREEVAKAEKELADTNAILEKKVEERTKQLGKATDALVKKERLAAIGEMASIISHEIRNPLAVISNSTHLIRAIVGEENPKLKRQFDIIDSEVRQANRIVEEVLGYARDRKQNITRVDLNSYLKDIVTTHPLPQGIRIVQNYDETHPAVNIDSEEIKQAVRNLITNAFDVMPDGGTLNIGTKAGKKVVCLYVCDEGTGMGEDTLLRIFTPFFTTKARGTGLGLAVVKKAVSNNKGKMFVESEPDQGTKFKIYLKRAE